MTEFGDQYSDDPDGIEGVPAEDNKDPVDTKDEGDTKGEGETKDDSNIDDEADNIEEGGDSEAGEKTLDLAEFDGKEPVEKLFSDDESANKTVDPPVKEEDITKSGCSAPANFGELMEKGSNNSIG